MNPTIVTLEAIVPIKLNQRKARHRVWLHDGTLLLDGTLDPEHAACRALLARGATGAMWTRWKHRPDAIAMKFDIERHAKVATSDADKYGLQSKPFQEFHWAETDNEPVQDAG